MQVSLSWLSTHLDLSSYTVPQLSDLLTFAGVEVEGIEERGVTTDKVVVAQIDSFVQHPNADKLSVCQVNDGSGTPRQIVCGAKNFKAGDKVPLALPGAVLPGGFTIKEGKLRDVASLGMMCSGKELGLGDDHSGLLILSPDSPIGTPFNQLVPSDVVFDLEITPNRPDLLSHLGLARELSALTGIPLKGQRGYTATKTKAAASDIKLEAKEVCPLYTARLIKGVKVGPSPEWLRRRLESIGLRPINSIVDITNYVLLELGHPMHAFDLDTLAERRVALDRGLARLQQPDDREHRQREQAPEGGVAEAFGIAPVHEAQPREQCEGQPRQDIDKGQRDHALASFPVIRLSSRRRRKPWIRKAAMAVGIAHIEK